MKYREGFWSTVVWLELKVWLVADQTNLAAVEVCNLKAGMLPFGSQTILDKIADVARESSIDVTWYRHRAIPSGCSASSPSNREPPRKYSPWK